jgi:hypothetical protein
VLRLVSLLWRLRSATTIETGLFDIQADHLSGLRQPRQVWSGSQEVIYALFGRADASSSDPDSAVTSESYVAENAARSVKSVHCHKGCKTLTKAPTLKSARARRSPALSGCELRGTYQL